MSLWKSAIIYRRAEAHYHRSFREYVQLPNLVLPDQRFWELQTHLLNAVAAVRLHEAGACCHLATLASERFLRQMFLLGNQPPSKGRIAFPEATEAILFAKAWQNLQQRLQPGLVALALDAGAEICERWSDALPLAGRTASEALLRGEVSERLELEGIVRSTQPARPWLVPFIWQSRGLWSTALLEAAQAFFATLADQEAQEIDWIEASW